jgi:hypothetical protein
VTVLLGLRWSCFTSFEICLDGVFEVGAKCNSALIVSFRWVALKVVARPVGGGRSRDGEEEGLSCRANRSSED